MGFRLILLAAMLSVCGCSCARAAEAVSPAPAVSEQVAHLDGTSYTVVAPIFLGAGSATLSYLRFYNANLTGSAANVNVTVVGDPSGAVLGTTSFLIPPAASPQYSINDIMTAANASVGSDTSVALYLKKDTGSTSTMAYQHVAFNAATGFFENLSICPLGGLSFNLINVHTSRLSSYPTNVVFYNPAATQSTFFLSIFEARTGVQKGFTTVVVAPNSSVSRPFSYFEQQIGWSPAPNEVHANLGVLGVGVIAQVIANQATGSYVNMTQACFILY